MQVRHITEQQFPWDKLEEIVLVVEGVVHLSEITRMDSVGDTREIDNCV